VRGRKRRNKTEQKKKKKNNILGTIPTKTSAKLEEDPSEWILALVSKIPHSSSFFVISGCTPFQRTR
jgi:hypothetical protein